MATPIPSPAPAVAPLAPALLSRTDAARYLGVSVSTIDRLRRAEILPTRYVMGAVRIPRDALDALAAAGMPAA